MAGFNLASHPSVERCTTMVQYTVAKNVTLFAAMGRYRRQDLSAKCMISWNRVLRAATGGRAETGS